MINVGDLFLLRVRGQDLRSGGDPSNRGVDNAFLDLLYGSDFAEPVTSIGHPLGFNVVFDGDGVAAGSSSVAASPAPTETTFTAFDDPSISDDDLDPSSGFYANRANLIFTSGILAGQSGAIIDYTVDGDNRTFQFGTNTFFDPNTNLPIAPSPGDSFRIEFERYSVAQGGEAQSPAAGQIDEAGAGFAPVVSPTGEGLVTVFTVLMRATGVTPAARPLVILGDPADDGIATQVIVAGDPINLIESEPLEDDEVFLRPSTSLVIIPAGEGEFTNLMNPVDVNGDNLVSTVDAVIVINYLNGGSLGGKKLPTVNPSSIFIDVNRDNYLSIIDALLVINRLRSPGVPASSTSSGEGESTTSSNASLNPVLNTVLTSSSTLDSGASSSSTSSGASGTASASNTASAPTSDYQPPATTAATTTTTKPKSTTVNKDAADDIFARLYDLTSLKRKT